MTIAAPHDEIYPASGSRPVGGWLKRGLDIAVALAALVLLAPLLAVVAVLVLLTMGRPVLRREPRVGFAGRTIECHRFRTTQNGSADPAALGVLLAQSGIEKLPQLFNVLKGDMSCVGPLPLRVQVSNSSERCASVRLTARPGVTGEWRLAAALATPVAAPSNAATDAGYEFSWSLRSDIGILFKSLASAGRSED